MGVSVGWGTSVLAGVDDKVDSDVGVEGTPQAAKIKTVRMTKTTKFFVKSPLCCDGLLRFFLLCKGWANGLR